MKSATIAKLRNNLSRYLREVQKGETIEVFDRDTPVARLIPLPPPDPGASAEEARLKALEDRGLLQRGQGRIPGDFADFPPPDEPLPPGAMDTLLDERR